MDTVGQNKKQMEEYIRHQVEEDRVADQMSLKEFIDPLAGNKNPKAGQSQILCKLHMGCK